MTSPGVAADGRPAVQPRRAGWPPAPATPDRRENRSERGSKSRHDVSLGARTRGTLVIAEKVVEKIAGQAAAEISAASGRSGGFLGIGTRDDSKAVPRVDVDLGADSADLSMRIGIVYPQSIRQATQQVREHVTRRVQELTGVSVHRLDIDVTSLTTPDSRSPDRGPTRGKGGLR